MLRCFSPEISVEPYPLSPQALVKLQCHVNIAQYKKICFKEVGVHEVQLANVRRALQRLVRHENQGIDGMAIAVVLEAHVPIMQLFKEIFLFAIKIVSMVASIHLRPRVCWKGVAAARKLSEDNKATQDDHSACFEKQAAVGFFDVPSPVVSRQAVNCAQSYPDNLAADCHCGRLNGEIKWLRIKSPIDTICAMSVRATSTTNVLAVTRPVGLKERRLASFACFLYARTDLEGGVGLA
ncbi:hypothetical protein CHS0354_003621 [Potamilus streckersoni]|uniref:Uncharacterized protein n=1 Tax=Potamilus streckersoni TaxID=2493646 RepID=A0AAE0S8T9_9BIVA|nr:hypothetical protein CHS0354_003621 [Potamilus streckersoni]